MHSRRSFLHRLGFAAAAPVLSPWLRAEPPVAFASSSPEAQGISSKAILAFLDGIEKQKLEFHGLTLVRHGKVIAEGWWKPYGPGINHTLYSLSKSFTSTAVGLAVAEGKVKLGDRVVSFFPDEAPKDGGGKLAAVTVRDLLMMAVGHEKDPTFSMVTHGDWVRAFLEVPVTRDPGTHFVYNSGATYLAGAIVQKVTGQKVVDFLTPRLFEPLGIAGMTWETCPRGFNTGGWGLSVPTGAIAKFAQLLLQQGKWQGRQLVPAEWIEDATRFHIQQPIPPAGLPKERNDWLQGYGYQFWRCRNNAFRGDGAFGQLAVVMPGQDMVLAVNAETNSMQGQLDLIWEHLLPAAKSDSLAADPAAEADLRARLAALALKLPEGATGAAPAPLAGRRWNLSANPLKLDALEVAGTKDGGKVTFHSGADVHALSWSGVDWSVGETSLPGAPPRLVSGGAPPAGTLHKVATAGRWKDDTTLVLTNRYLETPHRDAITLSFREKAVEVTFQGSVAQLSGKPDPRPVLTGSLAS